MGLLLYTPGRYFGLLESRQSDFPGSFTRAVEIHLKLFGIVSLEHYITLKFDFSGLNDFFFNPSGGDSYF